jgi:long-chain acyl-CoA synthetase
MRTGLGYLFDHALTTTPDRVAVIQDETFLTFLELDRRANRIAWALLKEGVGGGDRVALLFDNDYRFLECYFGTLRAGAVVVPVNHRLSNDAATYILDNADAQIVLCSASQVQRFASLWKESYSSKRKVGLDRSAPGMVSYDTWIAAAPDETVDTRISEDDIAIQAYTAGSTGKPKGCLLTHGGQLWNLTSVLSLVQLTSADRAVVSTPFGHKNATMSIKRLLRVGGSVVVLRGFDPETYLAAVDRHKVTCTAGVPAMYQMLVAREELFSRYDTRWVRICFVASAQVPYGLQETMRTCFPNARMQEIYGATEAGFLVQSPDGSPGLIPVPGAQVRVIREDGSECSVDEVGEVTFRNPGVARGYYKNPEVTAERIRDGWYHTGDLVRRTDEGRYFVLGRKDDMIITGGENVYPKEIEDILLRHPKVANACVVPISHSVKGQVPVAFVVLHEPNTATESEIKEFFLACGAPFAHPRRVFFIVELPLSAPGKVDRKALCARAESAVTHTEMRERD